MITLHDVHTTLERHDYRLASQQLQQILHTNPSADAWFLAAQLTLDRDHERAVRHLKRALLLDPHHGETRTMLGQLGVDPDITVADIADEMADVVSEHTNNTPLLRRLSARQRLYAVGGLVVLLIVAITSGLTLLFPRTGPAYIPEAAPEVVTTRLMNAENVFAQFNGSGIQMFAIEQINHLQTPGKDTLKFSLSGADGQLLPAQVVVYKSISDFIRDSDAHQAFAATSEIVARSNAMLVYDKGLQGLAVEDQLLRQFQVITGV